MSLSIVTFMAAAFRRRLTTLVPGERGILCCFWPPALLLSAAVLPIMYAWKSTDPDVLARSVALSIVKASNLVLNLIAGGESESK